jgi:hypothetical protein
LFKNFYPALKGEVCLLTYQKIYHPEQVFLQNVSAKHPQWGFSGSGGGHNTCFRGVGGTQPTYQPTDRQHRYHTELEPTCNSDNPSAFPSGNDVGRHNTFGSGFTQNMMPKPLWKADTAMTIKTLGFSRRTTKPHGGQNASTPDVGGRANMRPSRTKRGALAPDSLRCM